MDREATRCVYLGQLHRVRALRPRFGESAANGILPTLGSFTKPPFAIIVAGNNKYMQMNFNEPRLFKFCPFPSLTYLQGAPRLTSPTSMSLSTLPLEVSELIFTEVVWDGFTPDCVESLNAASDCIGHVHERNRRLRALRTTAKFVDCIVSRLAYKYVHITSQERAEELISAGHDQQFQGTAVRHLFLGDKSGRFHADNAPDYSWVTSESGRKWIEDGTFGRLLAMMPKLVSLHIHLPAIHSQIFSTFVREDRVAPLTSLRSIQYLSLYDDINNSSCYEPVKSVPGARDALFAFPNLRRLVISESEGFPRLDRLVGSTSSQNCRWYAPRLEKIMLEKWCPLDRDIMLYNLVMDLPLTGLRMLRQVPRRMSIYGILSCWEMI